MFIANKFEILLMRIPLISTWLAKKAEDLSQAALRKESSHLFGIEGLPFNCSELLHGKIYAVVLPASINSDSLVADSAENGIKVGRRVAVLSPLPHIIKSNLRARHSPRDENISSHSIIDLFGLNLTEIGDPSTTIWTLLSTLESYKGDRYDSLIYHAANLLFPEKSRAGMRRQIGIFRDWHKYHFCSGIFIFTEGKDTWPHLLRYANKFSGLARLSKAGTELSWQVNHWGGHEHNTDSINFPIGIDNMRSLYSLTSHNSLSASLRTPLDQNNVLLTVQASITSYKLPSRWYTFEHQNDLIVEAERAVGATIIIDFYSEDEWFELCRTVHRLRLRCGRRIKIIVREQGGRIDYGKEMLLYRLGANLLVHEDMSYSQLFRTVSSLKSQVFGRDINPDFDQLYTEANPEAGTGYMPPLSFTSTSDEFLRCSMTTGIDSVLVRFTLQPDVSHLDALKACYVARPGIFFTVDATSLYIFLFACPLLDAQATLISTFTRSLSELFLETTIDSEQVDINATLVKIRYNAEYVGYTDFSDILLQQSTEQQSAVVSSHEVISDNMEKANTASNVASTPVSINNVIELLRKPVMPIGAAPEKRDVIAYRLPLKHKEL